MSTDTPDGPTNDAPNPAVTDTPGTSDPAGSVGSAGSAGSAEPFDNFEPLETVGTAGTAGTPGTDGANGATESIGTAGTTGGSGVSDTGTNQPGRHRKAPRRHHHLFQWLIVVVVAILIALGLRIFVVQTFFVPSTSMVPTLQEGDRILVQKLGYSIDEGAIVVFRTPPGYQPADCGGQVESDLVKRVIGLPGETISSQGNTVLINGKPLPEPYLPKGTPLGRPIQTEKIPPNEYFVMGDNRPISCDSRVWGLVPRSDVVGRVFLVIWRNGKPDFHTF